MRIESVGRERAGWKRGIGGGGMILMLLIGVALVLVLMFGNFGGNQSYMQNVATGKKKGNEMGVDVLAYSLVQMITAVRASDADAVPMTFDDLGVSESAYIDPWGDPIRWVYDDPKHPKSVIVISDGPDNRPDTEDDVRVEKVLPL